MTEMPKLQVHKLLSALIQPISIMDYENLELSLIEFGCQMPILSWNNYIIDGHKRFQICSEYDISYKVKELPLSSTEEAISLICRQQLKRKDLVHERYKYLIGKWYQAERVLAVKDSERSQDTDEPISPAIAAQQRGFQIALAQHIAFGTVNKYRLFTQALDTITEISPQLGGRILSGVLKVSHDNTLDLSRRSPEDLKNLEKAVVNHNLTHIEHDDIRHEIAWARYEMQTTHRSQAPKKPAKEPVQAEIKKMPEFDPDAEISTLAFTIPSWCNLITKTKRNASFEKTSAPARNRLSKELLSLQAHTQKLLDILKEVSP